MASADPPGARGRRQPAHTAGRGGGTLAPVRWASRNRFAPVASVLVAVLTAALWIGLHAGGAMSVLELDTVDARFPARPDRPANDVAVVAVDDVTFNELRVQWPFRRSLHARVIDRLRKAGAKVIASTSSSPSRPSSRRTTR